MMILSTKTMLPLKAVRELDPAFELALRMWTGCGGDGLPARTDIEVAGLGVLVPELCWLSATDAVPPAAAGRLRPLLATVACSSSSGFANWCPAELVQCDLEFASFTRSATLHEIVLRDAEGREDVWNYLICPVAGDARRADQLMVVAKVRTDAKVGAHDGAGASTGDVAVPTR